MEKPAKNKIVRVLVADDHPLVREGICAALSREPLLRVVGEAADGEEALRLARQLKPDVVLLDLNMPRLGGVQALPLLRQAAPKAKIIVLTMHTERDYIRAAVRLGAKGYLLKDAAASVLAQAVFRIHAGGTAFSAGASEVVVTDVVEHRGRMGRRRLRELTAREREVLGLVAEGLSSRAIASRLGIAVRTVETHRERIMSKLDIHNMAGLVKYALSKGTD